MEDGKKIEALAEKPEEQQALGSKKVASQVLKKNAGNYWMLGLLLTLFLLCGVRYVTMPPELKNKKMGNASSILENNEQLARDQRIATRDIVLTLHRPILYLLVFFGGILIFMCAFFWSREHKKATGRDFLDEIPDHR